MYSKCLLEANGHESEAAEIVGGGLRDSLEGEGWLSFLFSSLLFSSFLFFSFLFLQLWGALRRWVVFLLLCWRDADGIYSFALVAWGDEHEHARSMLGSSKVYKHKRGSHFTRRCYIFNSGDFPIQGKQLPSPFILQYLFLIRRANCRLL